MSLNGLESPEVLEAYNTAIIEAGGWLLLKYASRDCVELLGRGKSGVSEARATLARYEEAAPVYGVLVYRRRKVLIKYIPEGTSRLLQARTAVHFQDVLEKYSPYEALLEIASAEALTDTTLAASFPLHTATPSAPLTRLRLDEITEDGEDSSPVSTSPATRTPNSSYSAPYRARLDRRLLEQRMKSEPSPTKSIDSTKTTARPISPLSSNLPSPTKTSVSQFLVRSDSGKPSVTSIGSGSLPSMAEYATSEISIGETQSSVSTAEASKPNMSAAEPSISERPSFARESNSSETPPGSDQKRDISHKSVPDDTTKPSIDMETASSRPSVSAQSDYSTDLFDFLKPKVKLGPRPVLAGEKVKSPTTATVSSMPATYRLSMRKQDQSRPNLPTLNPGRPPLVNNTLYPTPPPVPESRLYDPRPISRGSVKSITSHKSAMTPDKLRLMKAVELRKKQIRKSNPKSENSEALPEAAAPAIPRIPEQPQVEEMLATNTSTSRSVSVPYVASEVQPENVVASQKSDSGIQMEYEKVDVQRDIVPVEAPVVREKSDSAPSEQPQKLLGESIPLAPRKSPKLAIPGSFLSDTSATEDELDPTPDPSVYYDDAESSKAPSNSGLGIIIDKDTPPVPPAEDIASLSTRSVANGLGPSISNGAETKENNTLYVESDADGKSGDESASSSGLAALWESSPKRRNSDLARRRQGVVEPLQNETDPEISDDDLIDELQSAQLQEAKPVMVSRSSPVQGYFSPQRRPSGTTAQDIGLSSPISIDEAMHTPSPSFEPRAWPPLANRPQAPATENNDSSVGLKRNVSSEISKRIQALAGTSNGDRSSTIAPSSSRPHTPDSSTILSSARTSTHSRNRSYNSFKIASRGTLTQAQMTPNSAPLSQPGPVMSIQHDPNTNRDSVEVKARIVRPQSIDQTEVNNADAELQQSELTISHKRATPSQSRLPQLQPSNTTSGTSTPTQDSTPSRTVSATLPRASKESTRPTYLVSQQTSAASLTPTSFLADETPPSTSPLHTPRTPYTTNDENVAPKETTKTSRFFKRISHIGGKRRSGYQQYPEVNSIATPVSNSPSPSKVEVRRIALPPITVGDLNIQFPDSLLWKRRIVAIDEAGYMKFLATEHQSATTRRFQLSEFRMPYAPDLDTQELPNSIMLDFFNGTTLQIACEDTVTHSQVSHVLRTYWKAWAKSGGS